MFQIRSCSKKYGDERIKLTKENLWFLELTKANRNLGHDGISPAMRFGYLQSGLLNLLLILGSSHESMDM